MQQTRRIVLIALVAVATAAGVACTPPPATPAPPWVRVVYARPTDQPYRADYDAAVGNAVDQVQAWYKGQLGGKTIVRDPEPVIRCTLPHDSAYYRTDSWNRVQTDLQPCAPVAFDGTDVDWVVYADVLDECGAGRLGAANKGLAMMPRADLQGLVGEPQVDACGDVNHQPTTRWVGGLAHEMAHTLGVPHPPGCDQGLPTCDADSLMWVGYASYPNTYLNDAEKALMLQSPFIR